MGPKLVVVRTKAPVSLSYLYVNPDDGEIMGNTASCVAIAVLTV
jgi:hypothetical protein